MQRNAQRGFSLIELMIAIVLLLAMMATVFQLINLAIARSGTEQAKLDMFQESRNSWTRCLAISIRPAIPTRMACRRHQGLQALYPTISERLWGWSRSIPAISGLKVMSMEPVRFIPLTIISTRARPMAVPV
jgi:prepilin-type N-terminal cleavage/methylation domain-containing protein